MDNYRERPELNFSALKHIDISPKKFKHLQDNPGESDRPAYAMGRLIHVLVLEPQNFEASYCVAQNITSKQTKAWKEFAAVLALDGREALLKTEHAQALQIAKAVKAHPMAKKLLKAKGVKKERAIIWERFGVPLKSKLDLIVPGVAVSDLKSTLEIESAESFSRSALSYGYLAQFAFYSDAWHFETGEALPFSAIVAEKKAPFDVFVMDFGEQALAVGRAIYERWLKLFIECQSSGKWPGIAEGAHLQFAFPSWFQFPEGMEPEEAGHQWGIAS